MLLKINISEGLMQHIRNLKKHIFLLLVIHSGFVLLFQDFLGETVTYEFIPSSLLSFTYSLITTALLISLFQRIYPMISVYKASTQLWILFGLFISSISLATEGEHNFFTPWSEILFSLFVLIIATKLWKNKTIIAAYTYAVCKHVIFPSLKEYVKHSLSDGQVGRTVGKLDKSNPLKALYLVLYSIVFVFGTILEWALFIVLYPFKLYYRIFSSRAVLFAISQLVLVFFVILAFWTGDYMYLRDRVTGLVLKAGGDDSISCIEKDTISKLNSSIVRVVGGYSEGSGFVYKQVGEDSLILTNYHVIADEPNPKIVYENNKFLPAKIKYVDKDSDVAVLTINTLIPKTTWGNIITLNYGEDLLTVGFPFGKEIIGGPSIKRGGYYGNRRTKSRGIEYIQTDATINEGMSGGVMTDICGKVMGMNTLGAPGMGMAISSNSLIEILNEFENGKSKDDEIPLREFDPDKSQIDTIFSFYNYIKSGELDDAYNLLSLDLQSLETYEEWIKGYESTLQVEVVSVHPVEEEPNKFKVKISAMDLVDDEIVEKYFEGIWVVEKIDNHYVLMSVEMAEVTPDFYWFFGDN